MARLRMKAIHDPSSSDDAFCANSDSDEPFGHILASKTASRVSPKKKTVRINVQTGSLPDVGGHEITPPNSQDSIHSEAKHTQRSRQIRLKPLKELTVRSTVSRTGNNAVEETKAGSSKLLGKDVHNERLPTTTSIPREKVRVKHKPMRRPERIQDFSNKTLPDIWLESASRSKVTRFASSPKSVLELAFNLDHLKILGSDDSDAEITKDTMKNPNSPDKENDLEAVYRFSPPRKPSNHQEFYTRPGTTPSTPRPLSPEKPILKSPSKRPTRMPASSTRPSMDDIWDFEDVHGWNDGRSSRVAFESPEKSPELEERSPDRAVPTSPTKCQSPSKRSKAEIAAKKAWNSGKHELARAFLIELDDTLTNGQIRQMTEKTEGVQIVWSKKLRSTAGKAFWYRAKSRSSLSHGENSAGIVLAEKVVDDEHRLRNTLAHEFCHLCNGLISGIQDQPHGQGFKVWARQASAAFAHRDVHVATRHCYDIEYKYVWHCANDDCGNVVQRHSKSIDPDTQPCARCGGRFVQVKPVPRPERKEPPKLTAYAAYVKEHFATVKSQMLPGTTQQEVMEAVANGYHAQKAADEMFEEMEYKEIDYIVISD